MSIFKRIYETVRKPFVAFTDFISKKYKEWSDGHATTEHKRIQEEMIHKKEIVSPKLGIMGALNFKLFKNLFYQKNKNLYPYDMWGSRDEEALNKAIESVKEITNLHKDILKRAVIQKNGSITRLKFYCSNEVDKLKVERLSTDLARFVVAEYGNQKMFEPLMAFNDSSVKKFDMRNLLSGPFEKVQDTFIDEVQKIHEKHNAAIENLINAKRVSRQFLGKKKVEPLPTIKEKFEENENTAVNRRGNVS